MTRTEHDEMARSLRPLRKEQEKKEKAVNKLFYQFFGCSTNQFLRKIENFEKNYNKLNDKNN